MAETELKEQKESQGVYDLTTHLSDPKIPSLIATEKSQTPSDGQNEKDDKYDKDLNRGYENK